MQGFLQIGKIAREEFEKVGLRHFGNLRKNNEAEMGVAYITRFSTIQGTRGYKVFECVIKYLGDIRQTHTLLDYSAT